MEAAGVVDRHRISGVDTVAVILIGLLGAVLSEGFAWYFVYRTESYRSLLQEVSSAGQKLNKFREEGPRSLKRDAKIQMQEETLSKKTQSLGMMRLKAGLFSSVFYFLLLPFFNRMYGGFVVAQLPFEPILFFRSLAHRGLTTFEESDCSSMYLYILAIGFFRTNLQKITGAAPGTRQSTGDGGATSSGFSSWFDARHH